MRTHILIIISLLLPMAGHAILYPQLQDPKITSCLDESCTNGVRYSGVTVVTEQGLPSYAGTYFLTIYSFGVHCDKGDIQQGFSGCHWTGGSAGGNKNTHSPRPTSDCLYDTRTWKIVTSNSKCTFETSWGPHTGAAPGGECVIYGSLQGTSVLTPWGFIDPTTAANGGNRYCAKPLPPSVTCHVDLPPVIDHGDITTGRSDSKQITGVIQCGSKPAVTIVGGDEVVLAPGVVANLNATVPTVDRLLLKSELTTQPTAVPGVYSASRVVVVSPQ